MIKEYTIRNEYLEASFINIGAVITKLINLKKGINVIVSHKEFDSFIENPGSMNAIIGRHAGRLQDFDLDGKHYILPKNGDGFQLHGGVNGFNKKCFDCISQSESEITFGATSLDEEAGFPGVVKLLVTYKLIDDELHLIYKAETNKKTIISLTNHAYFNLNGNIQESILNHDLYLNANEYLELAPNLIPLRKKTVTNTPFDFRKMKKIGLDINQDDTQLKIGLGYDHPYIINKSEEGLTHVVTLKSPITNLTLDVFSNQDALVLYTGNQASESMILNDGVKGYKHCALCLESQGIPNSVNIEEFKERNIYDKGEVYQQLTVWKLY